MFKCSTFAFLKVFLISVLVSVNPPKASNLDSDVHVSFFGDKNELDIIHFEDEQSFIERFGDDPKIAKLFKNTSKISVDTTTPGDMGLPVFVTKASVETELQIKKGFETYGYNKYVSDLIPLERRLRDNRNEWCFTPNRISPILLPTSVIICFRNEALSVLLRTIYSVINRSPAHLLAEIILIDDFSDHDETNTFLEKALQGLSKVKLIRQPRREGLIRCRLLGALLAHAPVLTFVDSHVEVSQGWLQPLLDKVTKHWKTIAVPVFNYIDPYTFACNVTNKPSKVQIVGAFKWDLTFTYKIATQWDLRNVSNPADPVPSPTMSGGLFSIHRDFFDYLGKYDDQLEMENIELSFKAWMCGGRIEILPCSHVAYLEKPTYSTEHTIKNTARVAAVWLDEYSKYYFRIILLRKNLLATNYGDISSKLELKRKLNCSSFDWYLKTIIPSMFNPKLAFSFGKVTTLGAEKTSRVCLDSQKILDEVSSKPSFYMISAKCSSDVYGNQFWYHTKLGEIRNEEKCLDYFGAEYIVLYPCHGLRGNQEWEYHAETGAIVHVVSKLCLTNSEKLTMQACQGKLSQRWTFEVDQVHTAWNNFTFPRS